MTNDQTERPLIGSFRRLADRTLAYRLGAMSMASMVVALFDAAGLLLLIPLVDGLSNPDVSPDLPLVGTVSLGALVAVVVGFFLFKTLASAAIRWWASGVVARSSADAASALFNAYMRAPLEFHDTRNSATMVNTVQSTLETVFQRGFLGLVSMVSEGSTLLVLAVVVLIASPVPAVVGIVYFGVASVIFARLIKGMMRARARLVEVSNATAVRTVQEGLGGLREHRVRGSEAQIVSTYNKYRLDALVAMRALIFAGELSRFYLEALFVGGFGLVTFATINSGSDDSSLGGLALLLGAGIRVLPAISRLLGSFNGVRAGWAALGIVLDDLDALGLQRLNLRRRSDSSVSVEERHRGAAIAFDRVSFAYPGHPPALRSITLQVPGGTSLGVVGPSGAGKSTLVDLVCGVRTPTDGKLIIGTGDTQVAVGLVPQDIFLLDADIAANVTFGLPLDDTRVRETLERAQLWAFVQSLPDGVHTVIGERGTRLSGGQRQRLGIARALYGQPEVLVLDEATAALDAETEAAVVEAVESLSGDLTLLVVAHRLSTIRRCDQLAYLHEGRLQATGTFDEVIAKVPAFARAIGLAAEDLTGSDGRRDSRCG